jgi:hypothetical protein
MQRAGEDDGVDLDEWSQLGAADRGEDGSVPDLPVGAGSDSLRERLLAVLDDENASLVPPSAGDMTQAEWDSLSELEREGFRRLQLQQLDPRVVPRYTMSAMRSGSRSARVYTAE